jgi:hypothetical protein
VTPHGVACGGIAFGTKLTEARFQFAESTSVTESHMDVNKIAAAVQLCATDAIKSKRPFRVVNDFLAMLKREGWSEAERLEVQTHVLQALKRRRTG